ncbi:MAG: phosphopantetheine-binding protein [Bacteroidota bacterium]
MDIQHFIRVIEEEFEDIKPGSLQPESDFRKEFEFTSVNALVMMSLINVEYDVMITADDLRKCYTVSDLFNTVKSKAS